MYLDEYIYISFFVVRYFFGYTFVDSLNFVTKSCSEYGLFLFTLITRIFIHSV